MPPALLNIFGTGLFGGLYQLLLLPVELYSWVFRGVRYTLARLSSWAMTSFTVLAIVWMLNGWPQFWTLDWWTSQHPAPIVSSASQDTAGQAQRKPIQVQRHGPQKPSKPLPYDWFGDAAAARDRANDPDARDSDNFIVTLFFGGLLWLYSGYLFSVSNRVEQGTSRVQGLLGQRYGCPLRRLPALFRRNNKAQVVDVAAARGQVVLRGTAVQSVSVPQLEVDPSIVHIGGVGLNTSDECKHFLISGRTGAGKSQAIYGMLLTINRRGNPCMIADPGGTYLSRFGAGKPEILNPFDHRSVRWSPFAEIEHDYDCDRLAKAAIPDAEGDSKQWNYYAQTLLSELLRVQWRSGNHSTAELLRLASSASSRELARILRDTPAEVMTSGDSDRMLGSTRSIISIFLAGWRYLDDAGTYSVRHWARAAASGSAPWLFCVYRPDQKKVLRSLIACWLDLGIVELLTAPEKPERRVWFIADELDSLGKVDGLRDGLTNLRKYGGAVVAGLQTIAQLRETYGRDYAQVLLSCLSTKLILSAGDAETAKYFEDQIGKQEIERIQHSGGDSAGMHGPSSSNNWSKQQQIQSAVLASEIATLPDLQGYLQLPSGSISRVSVPYWNLQQQVPTFEPKPETAKGAQA